jgi:hypothetical protein
MDLTTFEYTSLWLFWQPFSLKKKRMQRAYIWHKFAILNKNTWKSHLYITYKSYNYLDQKKHVLQCIYHLIRSYY